MNLIKKLIYNYGVPLFGRINGSKNKYINVIYYHNIVEQGGAGSQHTDLALFKRHMEYIKSEGYKTYTFDELNADNLKYDSKKVLITFDDGWRSNYTLIFEYMKEMGIKYNVFLAVDSIDKDSDMLTWDMVREMHESGIAGFGAHTFGHVAMDDIFAVDLEREITEADRIIFENMGVTPRDFCYPYGKYSAESNAYMCEKTGYTRIYTSDLDYSYSVGENIIFGRSSINNDESFGVFKNKLNGNFNAFAMLKR